MLAIPARVFVTRVARLFAAVPTFTAFLFVPIFVLGACGNSPDTKVPTPTGDNKPAAKTKGYDLRPVPEPKNIIAWGRVSNPNAMLKIAKDWSTFPMPDSAAVTQLLAKEPLGALIDLDKPMEFVATLSGEKSKMKAAFVLSASVDSLEEALVLARKRHTVRESEPGIFPLGFEPTKKAKPQKAKGDPDDDDDDDEKDDDSKLSCVIAAALGPSPARFVCGNEQGLAELVPYATRTLPTRGSKEGVHVEVQTEVLNRAAQALAADLMGESPSKKQGAAWKIGVALLRELDDFAADVPKMEFDVFADNKHVKAHSTIAYRSTKSLVAQLWANRAGKAGPVSDVFWHLPKDSRNAFYWGGYDAKLFSQPRALLGEGLRELLETSPLVPADRTSVVDMADKAMQSFSQTSAWANGTDVDKNAKADSKFAFDAEKMMRDSVGWQLMVFEDPFATVAPLLKSAVAFYARPTLKKALDLDKAPKNEWDMRAPSLAVTPMPKAVPFGKDSLHIVFTIFTPVFDENAKPGKGKPKRKEKAVPVHIMAVADGPRTVMAVGFDEVALANRVKSSLAASPKVGTLAERTDLDYMRDPHVGYGGFSSVAKSMLMTAVLDDVASPEDAAKKTAEMAQHPIRMVGRAEQTDGPNAGRVTGSVELDRELVIGFVQILEKILD